MTNALFLGTPDDKSYLPYLKSMFSGLTTFVQLESIELLAHLEIYCTKRNITRVVCTQTSLLSRFLSTIGNVKTDPSLADYAGSLFHHRGIDVVFIFPLSQLTTVPYGKFLANRYISKVVSPESWAEATEFKWCLLTPENVNEFYARFSTTTAIAVDIETFKVNLAIRCIGYTAVSIDVGTGAIRTESVVLPITSDWALTWMRKFNDLPPAKIFQRGKYDNSYLLRYNAPCRNYLWDTANQFHSWYSELPKDLAFLNAFFLRKVVYWKDLAETTDLFEYYRYNALDTWATANVWIQWLLTAPDWAKHNYALEFPLQFPCLLAELTGIERDVERLHKARAEVDAQEESKLTSLRRMLGAPGFNPGSHVQVKNLLKVFGFKEPDSSDEKALNRASFHHPLIGRVLEVILDIRGLRKLSSTYLRLDSDAKQSGIHAGEGGAKEFFGRILYALNPDGTDTSRLASKEHHFWTGLQIQNITRGPEVKQTLRASGTFYLGECDLEQAESRDTAHIAGDEKLIAAVGGIRDFHSVNASAFFGRPYDSIYDDAVGKTKDKALRDLAKRVNHGANYNMGAGVLVETMGLANIYQAKRLLGLPFNNPKDIAQYLLDKFHATYPKLRGRDTPYTAGTYYASVAESILLTKKLVSRAFHHTEYNVAHYNAGGYIESGDWTRYCFGDPAKNKSHLNAYVAHCPQSLNARTLNEAFMDVFYRVALPNPAHFRLHAQIHDSILFSYAPGYEHLTELVRECMEIPVTVRDISGVYRTFTVPAALKLGTRDKSTGEFKRAVYWSETE